MFDDLAMFSLSKNQAPFADPPSPSNRLYAAFLARKSTIETFRSRPFSIRMLGTSRTHIPNHANAHDLRNSKCGFRFE
jgi:hypothetical protein